MALLKSRQFQKWLISQTRQQECESKFDTKGEVIYFSEISEVCFSEFSESWFSEFSENVSGFSVFSENRISETSENQFSVVVIYYPLEVDF